MSKFSNWKEYLDDGENPRVRIYDSWGWLIENKYFKQFYNWHQFLDDKLHTTIETNHKKEQFSNWNDFLKK